MELGAYIATAVVAYLLGSIPTGFLVARAKGIDIRSVGSGNIGATNVFRVLGTVAGVLVLLVDAAKGYLGCELVSNLVHLILSMNAGREIASREGLAVVGGVAAILGHNYTCWLHFRGGKGVATTAGVLLALFPRAFAVGLFTWLLVFAVSRYVSLASIAAALVLPFAVWFFQGSITLIVVAALLSALAIFKHKSNIQRLLTGTEHRLDRKKLPEESK